MPVGHFLVPYEYVDQPGDTFWRRLPLADQKSLDFAEAEIDGDQAIVRVRAKKAELANLATAYEKVRDPVALWRPTRKVTVAKGTLTRPTRTLESLALDVPDDDVDGEIRRIAEEHAKGADAEGYVRMQGIPWPVAAKILVLLGNAGYGLDRVSTGTFPVNGVLDDFNRGDNATSLGASWTSGMVPSWASHGVISNTGYASATFKSNYWNTVYSADMEVGGTVATAQSAGSSGLFSRVVTPGTNLQAYEIRWSDTNSFVFRWDSGGGGTQLGGNLFVVYATGNKVGMEIIGNTQTIYQNTGSWAAVATRNDTTYNASGRLGWATNDATTLRLDDFFGGQIVVATDVAIPPILGMGMGFGGR